MLDTPEEYGHIDIADALGDVEAASAEWAGARDLPVPRLDLAGLDAVVIAGVGGSGIVGDLVAALATPRPMVPVLVHKGYGLPAFAGPRTLVVAISYSGSTEETLSTVDAALACNARVLAVSSGGPLAARCDAAGQPVVRVPAGRQPRHSLGYLLVPVLTALGLADGVDEALSVQRDVVAAAGRGVPTARGNPAKQLALRLASGALPLVYGTQGLAAVAARRLKAQLNENAELLAVAGEIPELCHNEIVGFSHGAPPQGLGLVLVRDPLGEHPRLDRRVAALEEMMATNLAWSAEVTARGRGPLARLASLLLLCDLASVYTALELRRDPSPITAIERLKRAGEQPPLPRRTAR